MQIEFDKIAEPYRYPLSASDVKHVLSACVPTEMMPRLTKVHFGCNHHSTQEARIVTRGNKIDIRINFCPKDGKSRLLREKRGWCEIIMLSGGSIDRKDESISWTADAATKYATFLIAHEIAHVIYAERNGLNKLNGSKSSTSEEKWCDSFARAVIAKMPMSK
jgi:hypothetical protein